MTIKYVKLTQSTAWEHKHGQANRWISFQNRIFHLYKSVLFTQQRPRRPKTGIKRMTLMKRKTNFSFKIIPPGKTGLPFHVPLLSEISAGTNKRASRVPFTFQPEFLETSCRVWPSIVNCEWVFINYFSKDWTKFGKHAYRNKTCWEREIEKKKIEKSFYFLAPSLNS